MKRADLTGQRFGALTVIRPVPASEAGSHYSSWLCRCDCGAEVVVTAQGLRGGYHTSCGHHRKEVAKDKLLPSGKNLFGFYNGTKIAHLKKVLASDIVHGVEKRPTKRGGYSYRAVLELSGKRMYLGTFDTFEKAAAARRAAEQKYYLPIIAEWEALNRKNEL